MIKVDTHAASRTLIKAFKELNQKEINLSVSRAINGALGKTQTAAIRAVSQRYKLSYGDVASKLFVVKASPKSNYSINRGYLKVYNQPFPLSYFNPKQITDGVATIRQRKSEGFSSKRAAFLRANKQKVKNGVIVEVIRGEQKVIKNAFLSFRKGRNNPSVSARGEYNRGFNFKEDGKSKSLRGIGVASVLRSNEISPILQDYAENEYLIILTRELKKRVAKVGGQHSKYL